MILSALLLQTAVAPADMAALSARLNTHFHASVRNGRCKVVKTTGDAALDRVGCLAAEVCVVEQVRWWRSH